MKLGVLIPYEKKCVDMLARIGFNGVELSAQQGSEADAAYLKKDARRVLDAFESREITVTALGCYVNHLDPDETQRQQTADYMKKVFEAAEALGVSVVCTFAGRVPDKSVEDNIPIFKKVFSKYVKMAEDKGIKIAIENCPMMHGFPFRGINVAFMPHVWEMMFDAVPSDNLGLEMDPSHLAWLQIDYVKAVRAFGKKIFHVHAKDTEIDYEKLHTNGIYSSEWARFRIPGMGDINWDKFFSALVETGFDGGVAIEHEDPVLAGKRTEEGLHRGYLYLSRFFIM
jgi:sugar phosphate isomerase/epimerase